MIRVLSISLSTHEYKTGPGHGSTYTTNTILGFQNRASTQLRTQTFDIRLDDECRIGTLIHQNLVSIDRHHVIARIREWLVLTPENMRPWS